MSRLLLLAIFTWQLYTPTDQLRLGFQRTINTITLFCFNEEGMRINLETNTSVRLFVNRTDGPTAMDLERRVSVVKSGTDVTFIITSELEGYYTCARVTQDGIRSSPTQPLISLPSTDNPPVNNEMSLAVQSEDGEITIPCSYEPGRLKDCYYGEWTKNSFTIVRIGVPDMSCSHGSHAVTNDNPSKYRVDGETFSLIISSPNAKVDSNQYECHLRVLDLASSSGATAQFRSFPISLIVDGQPTITYAPKEVVIGLDPEGVELMKTATFKCIAIGRPVPNIEWFYSTISEDGTLGMPEPVDRGYIMNNDSDEDSTGRFNRTSILTMPVRENDGGMVRCQAGATFADARLTVLGRPAINIITTLRGEIVYDIGLKVQVYYPVKLKFIYVADGRHLGRDRQPDELFNDTKEIIYRENKEKVPAGCRRCYVNVSLTAMMDNQLVQGLSITSSDVIDVRATTPEQTIYRLIIGISVSCAVLLLVLGIGAVIITVIVCYCQKKQLKLKQKNKDNIVVARIESIETDVDGLKDCSDEDLVKRIKDKLKRLEEYVRTASDSSSDGTPQVSLKSIDQHLDDILSKLPSAL